MSSRLAWTERYGLKLTPLWAFVSIAALVLANAWREALLVALPEELLFRGVIQGEIGARMARRFVAPIATAALFAVAHVFAGHGVSGLLTFFPGLAFALLRQASGSIAPSVAAHTAANAFWLL